MKNIGELDASIYKLKLIAQGPERTNIDTKVNLGVVHPGDTKVVTFNFVNTGELCDHKVWAEVECYGLACPIQVSPGANMILETTPVGDDYIMGMIESGPDGVLQTMPVNDDRKVTVDYEAGAEVGIEAGVYVIVIGSGYDGILESMRSGDDLLFSDDRGDFIVPGPNRKLDTPRMGDDGFTILFLAYLHAYGEIYVGATAYTTVEYILPGPNMILDTVPTGDDVIMGMILAGDNYSLDTLVPAGDDEVIACKRHFIINEGGEAAFAVVLPPPVVSMDPLAPNICNDVTITGVFTNPGPVPVNVPVNLAVTKPDGRVLYFGTVIVVPKNGGEGEAGFTFHVDMGGDWSYIYEGAHNIVPGSFHVALGPVLEIIDIAQPSLVNVGDDVPIDVTVTNSGDAAGSDTLRVTVTNRYTGGVVFTEDRAVNLGAGATTVESFTCPTVEFPEGDFDVLAVLVDSGAEITCEFSVYQPTAQLAIIELTQPAQVVVGQDVPIDVTVENSGDLAGSDTLRVTITKNGAVVFTEDRAINLGPGATTTPPERFTYTTTEQGEFVVHAELLVFGTPAICRFTVLEPQPILSASATPMGQTVGVCTEATFTVTVTNSGTEDAYNVVVNVTPPAGVDLVSITPAQDIAVGESKDYTVIVHPTTEGDYDLTFDVTCDEGVTALTTAILHGVPMTCVRVEGHVNAGETTGVLVTIPIGASNVTIDMTCATDIDLYVYDGTTRVVGYGGLIDGPSGGSGTYHGDFITYTGYTGGNESATIDETSVVYTVKIYGFQTGDYILDVCYYEPTP